MNYEFIRNFAFQTIDGKRFKINDFDSISNYITKYPNKHNVPLENTIAYF